MLSKRTAIRVFIFIFLTELISLSVFLLPEAANLAFFVVAGLVLALTLVKLEYGLYIALAELIIGSKGYLFALDIGGLSLSIRIAIWLIIMSVWLGRLITRSIKDRKAELAWPADKNLALLFSFFAAFIIWGLANAFIQGNSAVNIFFDFNAWLYWLLLFPWLHAFSTKDHLREITGIALGSLLWLSAKSLFLLYAFSHNLIGLVQEVYRWTRASGIGEITLIQGGFHRVFFQSHIFALIGLLLVLAFLAEKAKQRGFIYSQKYTLILALILFSINLLSFSRSNWVGLAAGLILLFIRLIWKSRGIKPVMQNLLLWSALLLGSFVLIAVIVKFPLPRPTGGFAAGELLRDRASDISEGAAASSRWALLPELMAEIKEAPLLGQGFGAAVTYITDDPRIREQNPSGRYTTYAFEWGLLDIWLKLGLLGLLVYLSLLACLFWPGFTSDSPLLSGLSLGLAAIIATSIFSPYLNHPLGIGYIIIYIAVLNNNSTRHLI